MDRTAAVSPLAKLAAFGVVLAVSFGGGALIGATVGPEPARPSAPVARSLHDHPGAP